MKKILFAVAALMPILVLAKPFGAMSKEEINASDKERWGNRVSLSGQDAEEMDKLNKNLSNLTAKLNACTEMNAMLMMDRIELFKELQNTLAVQLVADNIGYLAKPDDPPHIQRGYERLNAFKVMLQAFERKSRTKLRILVTDIIGFQMIERRARWSSVQSYLENLKATEMFRELDKAYESFMHNMDVMTLRNTGHDVTGTELLMVSKLDKFADDDCTPSAKLDGRARIVDRYLKVMNKEALELYLQYTGIIKTESADTLNSLAEDHNFYEEYALKLLPTDRRLVEDFFKAVAKFLDQVDNFLVKESEKITQKALDLTGEIGRLRFCTGFSPYKSFLEVGAIESNCCPGYTKRITAMLAKCKNRYMNYMKAMRERYKNYPNMNIPDGWK